MQNKIENNWEYYAAGASYKILYILDCNHKIHSPLWYLSANWLHNIPCLIARKIFFALFWFHSSSSPHSQSIWKMAEWEFCWIMRTILSIPCTWSDKNGIDKQYSTEITVSAVTSHHSSSIRSNKSCNVIRAYEPQQSLHMERELIMTPQDNESILFFALYVRRAWWMTQRNYCCSPGWNEWI